MSAPPARRPLPERTRSSAKTCDAGDFSDFGEPARELELVAAGVDD
jgi:hypothetical protein